MPTLSRDFIKAAAHHGRFGTLPPQGDLEE